MIRAAPRRPRHILSASVGAALLASVALAGVAAAAGGLTVDDLSRLRAVGEVHLSPDASRIAYSVINNDAPGRPYSQLWLLDVASGRSVRVGDGTGRASSPRWSRDGKSIAYVGTNGNRFGLIVGAADGTGARFIAPITGTNHPLPSAGSSLSWSPDDARIAYLSSTPGPEQDANGDPMVITRYLYKPTASEGMTRFNDNRRLHIFVAEVATGAVRQLTSGAYYEHSIEWAPTGDRILFVSNHESNPDRTFNYDLFTADAGTGAIAQLTRTKNAEYDAVWSPDGKQIAYLGTTRELTSSETTMEDTHVWLMNADGTDRHEIGGGIDNRQGPPRWSGAGAVYTSVQERGSSHLYRISTTCGAAAQTCSAPAQLAAGSIGSWSVSRDRLAYALATPGAPAELYLTANGAHTKLTALNSDVLTGRSIAPVEALTFRSVDGTDIEAFVTLPPRTAGNTPVIVVMHGGPHGAQGSSFNAKAQVYAAHGFASLMVNYRGSTGYGQKLADAIFGDQNGGEAQDVLAGVDAALARYPFLDAGRLGLEGGSYGGQLTNWIVTRTDRFKAAIPIAGISNLVTQNYLSYYHDYLAVEFGGYPHEKGINDRLWERSAIRYVDRVRTPVMLVHGENDNDVPIAEAEQFYIALQDVGVETIMIRYPREGHGIAEVQHQQDLISRSLAWYDRHFAAR